MGWRLDNQALTYMNSVVQESVRDPVGPEFMAPPEHRPEEAEVRE
jgi:hypothetical protein